MAEVAPSRTRRPGGGRKKLTETDPTLLADLQSLVEPTTRGDPMAPLLWTSRSLRNLADALQVMGHCIKVGEQAIHLFRGMRLGFRPRAAAWPPAFAEVMPWGGSQTRRWVYSYAPGRGHAHANTLLGDYRGIRLALRCHPRRAAQRFSRGLRCADRSQAPVTK